MRHARDDADAGFEGRRQDPLERLSSEHVENELNGSDMGAGDGGQRLFTRLDRDAVGSDAVILHECVKGIEDTVVEERHPSVDRCMQHPHRWLDGHTTCGTPASRSG